MKQDYVRFVAGLLIANLFLCGCTVFDELAFASALAHDGGLRAVFVADRDLGADEAQEVKTVIESRLDGLGVLEYRVRAVDSHRFVVVLVGVSDQELVLSTIQHTGLLEFVDFGTDPPPVGAVVRTDCRGAGGACLAEGEAGEPPGEASEPIYHTVMTGDILSDAYQIPPDVSTGLANWAVGFLLTPEGRSLFGEYTASHIGEVLGVLVDGRVITTPTIREAIYTDSAMITGDFTADETLALVIQLRYGALPVPLALESVEVINPVE